MDFYGELTMDVVTLKNNWIFKEGKFLGEFWKERNMRGDFKFCYLPEGGIIENEGGGALNVIMSTVKLRRDLSLKGKFQSHRVSKINWIDY
jgi:hypothetical protein